ncbi:MAG TPA: EscU/YscU/HrcU family type III secretion system export apparatus switch protein [Oscillospiraceae bacterium]|nr:EscU/YscU/HrcU family type III secretion system export apparatus switch protein [Oscillospiraceae bacterium]
MSQFENHQHATALKYSKDAPGNAPVVVASGMGYMAQKIIDVAQENNVPIYQDDSLSSLLSQLEVGSEIPPELYQAIVDLYVYFLNFTVTKTE